MGDTGGFFAAAGEPVQPSAEVFAVFSAGRCEGRLRQGRFFFRHPSVESEGGREGREEKRVGGREVDGLRGREEEEEERVVEGREAVVEEQGRRDGGLAEEVESKEEKDRVEGGRAVEKDKVDRGRAQVEGEVEATEEEGSSDGGLFATGEGRGTGRPAKGDR